MNTFNPWGISQHTETIAEGIVSVSTAGHGGLLLSEERLAAMPRELRCNVYGHGQTNAFEEDCEWALVALAFPECFNDRSIMYAVRSIWAYRGKDPYQGAAAWLESTPAGLALVRRANSASITETPVGAEGAR